MEGFGIIGYYYLAWFPCIIGIGIIINALFFIRYKTGKVLLKFGFICLIPILFFMLLFAQQRIVMWNNLSPMQKAIANNRYNKVKKLIEKGYDLNEDHRSYGPSTPLTFATDKGKIRIVRLLTENGADINLQSRDPWGSPLEIAIYRGDTAIVNHLLAQGADVAIKENFDPILLAVRSYKPNSMEVINSLLKYGADINANNSRALREAITPYNNTNYIAYFLLEQGAQVNDLPKMKNTVKYCLDNIAVTNHKRYEDSLQLVKIMKFLEEYELKQADVPAAIEDK